MHTIYNVNQSKLQVQSKTAHRNTQDMACVRNDAHHTSTANMYSQQNSLFVQELLSVCTCITMTRVVRVCQAGGG